ncbi:MAG: hypothetical protein VKJ05_06670 [Synechococcaceae cyanobacterium]|nr:hypothetical protein [Synechococcaceae cyanobacterium]
MTHPSPSPSPSPAPEPVSCLGRTCLHWREDGELIDDDRELVLQRLGQVDPQVDPLTAA